LNASITNAFGKELWVFAYGSLMWRPGFDYDEMAPAKLVGAHRSLCIYSVVHRGTRRKPGLVLGLDVGGFCHGVAFRATAAKAAETLCRLRKRELVTNVYREQLRSVTLLDGRSHAVRALCYMVDRSHPQYAGAVPLDRQVEIVRNSQGRSGRNIDYVLNTAGHLRDFNVSDAALERLLVRLGRHRNCYGI
jgi:glutathione-specific gamma-glutamylcyclotransferase